MFARIGRLVRGFFGLFISGIEEANPEALMEAARQEFRTEDDAVQPGARQDGGRRRAAAEQVKGKAARAQDLERRILANHSAGNIELAGTLARELQELKADLTDRQPGAAGDRRGLSAEPAPGEGRRSRTSRTRSASSRSSCRRSRSRKRRPRRPRRSRASAFKVGDLGDTMKTVEEILQKRYEVSAGKARVASDMVDIDAVQEKEGERKALEQAALAEFLASQGMQAARRPVDGDAGGQGNGA